MMRAHNAMPAPEPGNVWVPTMVTFDPTLTHTDKVVYMLVAADDQERGVCEHRPALLAHDAGCSVRHVRVALATLEQRGLITRTDEGERAGWHAPLDIVNRATVAANGAVLVPVGKEEKEHGR